MEMLKHVPCFTDVEPPSTKMSDFFPLTKRISVNLGGDPPSFVSTKLLFGTPESAVARIQQLSRLYCAENCRSGTFSYFAPFFNRCTLHLINANFASGVVGSWYPQHGAVACPAFQATEGC